MQVSIQENQSIFVIVENHKVLFIQTAFIGDVILFTSILETWGKKYPDSKVDVLVRKGNENLLQNHPLINQLFIWDKKQNKYKNLVRLGRELKKEKYDLVVNFQRFFASGFLTVKAKAKESRGYSKNPLSLFFSKKYDHEIGNGKHEIERNHALIQDLVGSTIEKPKLYPSKEDFETIKPYIRESYVCMAPTSVWFTKQMAFDKWVELIKLIPSDIKIYLIGAPGDQEFCDQLIQSSSISNIENLCGKLTLLQSAALIKGARMNYVNDSAPQHLASAMNAPTTAFFCSTVPDFGFGPLSDESYILQNEDKLECRPCGLHGFKECPKSHFKCGNLINIKTNLGE